jgi:hypothetical protein
MPTVIKRPGRPYYIIQYFDAAGQRKEKSTKTTDYKTAERIAAKIQNGTARRLERLNNAKDEAVALGGTSTHRGTPGGIHRQCVGRRGCRAPRRAASGKDQ